MLNENRPQESINKNKTNVFSPALSFEDVRVNLLLSKDIFFLFSYKN